MIAGTFWARLFLISLSVNQSINIANVRVKGRSITLNDGRSFVEPMSRVMDAVREGLGIFLAVNFMGVALVALIVWA